jgi:hypothetical protein
MDLIMDFAWFVGVVWAGAKIAFNIWAAEHALAAAESRPPVTLIFARRLGLNLNESVRPVSQRLSLRHQPKAKRRSKASMPAMEEDESTDRSIDQSHRRGSAASAVD